MATAIEVWPRLDPEQVREVLSLVDEVADQDGTFPLSEHVILHLRHGGDADTRNVLARASDGHLSGYAHGIGHALVAELLSLCAEAGGGERRLRLWAHGESSAAHALATSMGFTRARVLWQMRRSLYAALPTAQFPPGTRLRSFLPGIDDADWLGLNAAAFEDLPDQGRWTADDLSRRMGEDWFDPQGFLLAEASDGSLAGFHWTKIHGAHSHGDHHHHHAHDPIGEVYVIGVGPGHRGTGLGRALLLAGLQHLRAQGLTQAMLYVDSDNRSAIHLYESLGFVRWDTDVLYRR